jgi:hypothetical protein
MTWLFSQALMTDYANSHCSQEPGAESLAENFSDGEPSVQLNKSLMQLQYYSQDKTTLHSRLSRFGMTYAHLMGNRGEDVLMLFLGAFPVKTLAQQERALDSTASVAVYGQKWRGSLAKYNPNTHSLKTAQCSLLEDLIESSVTLPRWGLMRNGELYQQQTQAHRINVTASGLKLPTPVASDATTGAIIGKDDTFYTTSTGMPRKINRNGKDGSVGLGRLVKMWPTPTASAAKGSSPATLTRSNGRSRINDRLDHKVMDIDNGQLNPTWVEWLMGWPSDHTGLKPLVTGKYHEFLRQHGIC